MIQFLPAGSSFQVRHVCKDNDGDLIVPAAVSAISYEVWRHFDTTSDVQTGSGPLVVGTAVMDPPASDGANVVYDVDGADVDTPGLYEIVTLITLVSTGLVTKHVHQQRFTHEPA